MSVIGQLREFDQAKESFEAYIERLENFMKANGVKEESQVAVLLTAIGPETYGLLRNLLTPEKPDTKSYKELVEILNGHLHPKPLVIAERFNFHNRFRNDSETVSDFAAQLKKFSAHCEFGTFLDDALRDRFVCGLRKEPIQRKLLGEKTLTFTKALEVAQSMEMAERKSSELKESGSLGSAKTEEVHQFGKKPHKTKKFHKGKESSKSKSACYRCGSTEHHSTTCKYKTYKCNACGKLGHLQKVCRSKDSGEAKYVETTSDRTSTTDDSLGFFRIHERKTSSKAVTVAMVVQGQEIMMEVDTGASVTVIPKELFKEKLGHLKLQPASTTLKTYGGSTLPLSGETQVRVEYKGQRAEVPLIVADVQGKPAILGRNWLSVFKLNWEELFRVSATDLVQELTARFKGVFRSGLGKIKEFEARVNVQPDATPRFHKARPVPYALKPAVEAELDRMEKEGIVTKVSYSAWAAPLVVVPKADGGIRLCGDYKVTVNPVLDVDQYPLPNPQDLLSALAGGTKFTKLDLKHAYQQLPLSEDSKKYLTINTCKGLYQYNRLAFGVASAPAVFQSTMDTILKGIDGVVCYIDDILITGRNDKEHKERLEAVLDRLEKYGICLKLAKCSFLQDKVCFLGHIIDAEGVHPSPEKVRAIVEAPTPTNVAELRSFLGMLQYYGKFLPNLSTLLQPLNSLLRDGVEWLWLPECERAFESAKKLLQSAKVLTHYDVNLPIKLACDASPYGIGAVISHVMPGGEERPIAFASRTLTGSEKNYAQLEKEALSIIYGVKKFHQYLYGRRFTLETDHKPLLTIFGPKSAIPTLAAARLQRWALILASHQYDVVFRKGADHSNADGLSRLPADKASTSDESDAFHFTYVNDLPVLAKDIASETKQDSVLCKVLQFVKGGWPQQVEDEALRPYFYRRLELSVEQDCVLWGMRVVIPEALRDRVLLDLHSDHPGICRMKSLARSYLWWPKLDQAIETMVHNCTACQSVRKQPATAPLIPWKWPVRVWQRVHIDYAEKDGVYFFVVVDAHSKWPEVFATTSTTTTKTIEMLTKLFAAYGLPEEIVSDNGPQFTSEELCHFMQQYGITHTRIPPYHPASNGEAERYVQILKQALLTSKFERGKSIQQRLSSFLFSYRNTPHSVTDQTPAELFLKRKPRTRLSLLQPNLAQHVEERQTRAKQQHDGGRVKSREFLPGDQVLVRNFRGKDKWKNGTVILRIGPLAYQVRAGDRMCHVHIDHLLPAGDPESKPPVPGQELTPLTPVVPSPQPTTPEVPTRTPEPSPPVPPESGSTHAAEPSPMAATPPSLPDPPRRYPKRTPKPVERLNL